MMRALALVGLCVAALASAGCAHECRCVCVDGANRAVATTGRAGHTRPAAHRLHRTISARGGYGIVASPFARLSPNDGRAQLRPKPWSYPDPFDADPFELAYSDERMAAAGKHFDAAVALEEAEQAAAERARSERAQQEAQAAAFADELRKHLQQLARP